MAKAFKVKATRNGYRRAGHAFSTTDEKTLFASDLTKEQIEQLQTDPNLIVVETDAEKPKEKKGDKDGDEDKGGGKGGDGAPKK